MLLTVSPASFLVCKSLSGGREAFAVACPTRPRHQVLMGDTEVDVRTNTNIVTLVVIKWNSCMVIVTVR